MNNRELIQEILNGIADDIRKEQIAKGLRASGKSAAALTPMTGENVGSLKAPGHIVFTIKGRKPGPFKDGVKTMLEWIEQKGITPNDDRTSLRSLAFLFARKISQRGNDLFLGQREGLGLADIVAKWKQVFVSKFKENLKQYVHGAQRAHTA
jgi:hypothetical protein